MLIDIITIFNHELFDEDIQFDYDFAILHLAEISKFPSKAGFIALPSATDEPADGEAMIVTGWGDTQNPLESPLFLRAVEVRSTTEYCATSPTASQLLRIE